MLIKSTKLKLTLTLNQSNILHKKQSSQSPKWEQSATVEKLVAAVEAKAAGAQYPSTKEREIRGTRTRRGQIKKGEGRKKGKEKREGMYVDSAKQQKPENLCIS